MAVEASATGLGQTCRTSCLFPHLLSDGSSCCYCHTSRRHGCRSMQRNFSSDRDDTGSASTCAHAHAQRRMRSDGGICAVHGCRLLRGLVGRGCPSPPNALLSGQKPHSASEPRRDTRGHAPSLLRAREVAVPHPRRWKTVVGLQEVLRLRQQTTNVGVVNNTTTQPAASGTSWAAYRLNAAAECATSSADAHMQPAKSCTRARRHSARACAAAPTQLASAACEAALRPV